MFNKQNIRKLMSENYPLLFILIGTILVSISIGPYQNLDSVVEYEAASGVIQWGMPFVKVVGNFVNEPPLGFYSEALFFKAFGSSIDTGVILVTLFGIGCAILAYMIGKELYGKTTGLFTAALFGLAPWELVLSRSFLIDTECLFFSLLCFYFGILAIRKNSVKFSAVSGVFFAAAFLTKFYAAFVLVPLLVLFVYYRPKKMRHLIGQLFAFCLPPLIFAFLWYQVVVGQPLLSVFHHSDFADLNYAGVVPTYSFVSTFLLNYGLGFIFLGATIFSLLLGFSFRKIFSKMLVFDLIWLVTIAFILGVDMVLGAGMNLKVPYNSAIKYDYQALPFFCLIVASLASKSLSLFNSAKSKISQNKMPVLSIGFIAVIVLAIGTIMNFYYANQLSITGFLIFRVKMNENVGYSLFNYSLISQDSLQFNLQYLGFAFVLLGLAWACRYEIYGFFRTLFKPMRCWIEEKRASYQRNLHLPDSQQ